MLVKFKMWMDVFGKITVGAVISAAIFITVFWGSDTQISIRILWQVLALSFVCSMGILMFPGEGEQELSKKGMFVRRILCFVFENVTVLGLGYVFGWFAFSNLTMVLLMEVLIIAVFAVVCGIGYFNEYVTAQSMNRKLKEKRENHVTKYDRN